MDKNQRKCRTENLDLPKAHNSIYNPSGIPQEDTVDHIIGYG